MNRVLIGIGLFILLLWPGLCPAAEPAPETPSEQSAAAAYEYRDPLFRDTPRGALQGFMQYAREGDYQTAAEYLDLRFLPTGMTAEQGPLYARHLLAIIERNLWLNPQELDDTPEAKPTTSCPPIGRDLPVWKPKKRPISSCCSGCLALNTAVCGRFPMPRLPSSQNFTRPWAMALWWSGLSSTLLKDACLP